VTTRKSTAYKLTAVNYYLVEDKTQLVSSVSGFGFVLNKFLK
jgi:hypothetical protein